VHLETRRTVMVDRGYALVLYASHNIRSRKYKGVPASYNTRAISAQTELFVSQSVNGACFVSLVLPRERYAPRIVHYGATSASGACSAQSSHSFWRAPLQRCLERRGPVRVGSVKVGTRGCQDLDHIDLAKLSRHKQRRAASSVAKVVFTSHHLVDVGVSVDQQ
jgi:hypothetical protein